MDEFEALVGTQTTHTLPWQHIVSDAVFSQALARQSIIGHKYSDLLETCVRDLYTVVFQINSHAQKWDVQDALKTQEDFLSAKARATQSHNDGKAFLRIRAGVNVCLSLKGEEQVEQAKAMLAKCNLPSTLTKAFTSCVHKGQGAGAVVSNDVPAGSSDMQAICDADAHPAILVTPEKRAKK